MIVSGLDKLIFYLIPSELKHGIMESESWHIGCRRISPISPVSIFGFCKQERGEISVF